MSNFQFLEEQWPRIYQYAKKAEERVHTEPISSAAYGRLMLEGAIYEIYRIDRLELPINSNLSNDVYHLFKERVIRSEFRNTLKYVREIGNNASHIGDEVNRNEALISIKYLFDFLKWFASSYGDEFYTKSFDESFIPKVGGQGRKIFELKQTHKAEMASMKADMAAMKEMFDKAVEESNAAKAKALESEEAMAAYQEKMAHQKAALEERKISNQSIPISSEFTEAETRNHLIDLALKQAGWRNLKEGYDLEFPVQGMPITGDNPNGNGYVDYVLWDDNGLPLAVVEAKRASADPKKGAYQAKLYADCLEQMKGQRPVIFYTNGFTNYLLDDTFDSQPREVYGFYTKEELQFLVQQRKMRTDIRLSKVDKDIAGRDYQIMAIQRVAEAFVVTGTEGQLKANKRRALLVMATGTGKTRTAAALVKILYEHFWAKRILFLADRNALVRQAKKNFGEHLKSYSSVNLGEEKDSSSARIVFSTYQTMINQIDKAWDGEKRTFGVGHFDLIILDESHRSIYNRYGAIFEYFDAMIIGLTATPNKYIDRNTFSLFGCGDEDPTFNYSLEEAVPKYLTPYKNYDISTQFLREGIKYNDLSDEEKEEYENKFSEAGGLFPEEIKANAMNKWLFNEDTVYKVLDTLMEEGLKIEGGDQLGRTIIFAVNQSHAEFIVKCFKKRYPEKASDFIAMIHGGVSHKQSLIDEFCNQHEERMPQIAVSVDMMDTGIDAPRVLNLLFFKVVRSPSKFWQMIGRGTRLCPDVYGPAMPKTHFLIFDVCQNFEFFAVHKDGKENSNKGTITQQIFQSKVQLSQLLIESGGDENQSLAADLRDQLHKQIQLLDDNRFQVNMHRKSVDEFSKRERWNNLSTEDVQMLINDLSALPPPSSDKEIVRRFDLMSLKWRMAELLALSSERKFHDRMMSTADALSNSYNISEIANSRTLIEQLRDPDFYTTLTQRRIQEIADEIRELMKYIERSKQQPYFTNFEDSPVSIGEGKSISAHNYIAYKTRVEKFIRDNANHITISKLRHNQPITAAELVALENMLFDGEERGTKETYIQEYGDQPLGTFIRSILGLEVEAARAAFADFLQAGNLRADQMTFIDNIITYLTKNGTIEKRVLFESPFNDQHEEGVLGVFEDAEAVKIISIINEINGNASLKNA